MGAHCSKRDATATSARRRRCGTPVYTFTAATGANGNIGGEAARALLRRAKKSRRRVRVRIAARNVDKARREFAEFGRAVEVVFFDFSQPETYAVAVDGAEAVYLGAPDGSGLDTPEQLEDFIRAAESVRPRPPLVTRLASGTTRHGTLDTRRLCEETGCVMFDHHFLAAEKLGAARRAGRVPVVLVDVCSWFFQNLVTHFRPLVAAGHLAIPNDNASLPRIDARDVGEFFAAVMLGRDRYEGRDFLLTGPARATPSEEAELISRATGRKVVASSREDMLRGALSNIPAGPPGVTLWDLMLPFYRLEARFSETVFDLTPAEYERVTGLKHRSLEAYVREEAAKGSLAAGGPPPSAPPAATSRDGEPH